MIIRYIYVKSLEKKFTTWKWFKSFWITELEFFKDIAILFPVPKITTILTKTIVFFPKTLLKTFAKEISELYVHVLKKTLKINWNDARDNKVIKIVLMKPHEKKDSGMYGSIPFAKLTINEITTIELTAFLSGVKSILLGSFLFGAFIIIYVLVIVGMVWIQLAERRLPIQYANRTNSAYGGRQNFLPIKINSAGVIPVIFASTLITIPVTIVNLINNEKAINFVNNYIVNTTLTGFILYVLLILFFGYFYTFLQMNPEEMSKNLSKSGAYIPGVRPGNDTIEYVSDVLSKLTIVGSLFLVVIAGLPIIFGAVSGLSSSVTIGGTGLLIVVGVAIETYKQLESSLVSRSHRATIRK